MTAATPAVYYAMARPLRLQPARFEVGTLDVTERIGILPAPKPDILMQGAIGVFPLGVPVVVIEGMGKHLVRIIERDGTRRLVVDDGTTWHCEGDAVGVYGYGICSPAHPIHYSPCGWRPGDGWRSVPRLGHPNGEAGWRREVEGNWL